MLGNRRNDHDVVRARFAGVVNADGDLGFAAGYGIAPRFDRDAGERVEQLRPAARNEPNDVGADRLHLEGGDGGLKFDRRAVFDRADDAVRDLDAALFAGSNVADVSAVTPKQRRVPQLVVEVCPVEPAGSDQVDEPVGKIETHPNARLPALRRCYGT